jgi:hypothetical protein
MRIDDVLERAIRRGSVPPIAFRKKNLSQAHIQHSNRVDDIMAASSDVWQSKTMATARELVTEQI